MAIFRRADPRRPDPETVSLAARVLESGGLIVYPTDTVYGLGCNPFNPDSVRRLFAVKRRPLSMAVPVAVWGIDMSDRLTFVGGEARALMRRFWPGPLTIVLRRRDTVPALVAGGGMDLGVRMPDHEVPLQVMKEADLPIVTTSANVHGEPSPSSAEELADRIIGEVDLVLDGGRTVGGVESTVVDLTVDPPEILREGPIPRDLLLRAVRGS
jgi:L-threonylcarbamoyladenylate synthase